MAKVLGVGGVFFKSPDPDGNKVELWEPRFPERDDKNE
jgi:hypothetical protein